MDSYEGGIGPSGELHHKVIRANGQFEFPAPLTEVPAKELTLAEIMYFGLPRKNLPEWLNNWKTSNFRHLWRGAKTLMKARSLKVPHFYGQLSAVVIRKNGAIEDYGLISCRLVTDAGVGFIVDAFQNIVELETMKFHGIGTGAVAEAQTDTALGTELTTQYSTDNTRATGSTTENGANVYRTVGTNTVDAAVAITEHGILSQAATGGGVLLDRSVFSVVNLANGDSLQTTYDFTINAGG